MKSDLQFELEFQAAFFPYIRLHVN